MRKFIIGLIAGLVLATTLNATAASNAGIKIFVNNKEISAEKACISDGVTLVPLKTISGALGASIRWEEETRSIYITSDTRSILTLQDITNCFLPAVVTIETDDSYGTGFFVSPDGKIITCAHVIDDYEDFIITMRDGKKLNATLLIKRNDYDLALLKVAGNGYPYILDYTSEFIADTFSFSFPRNYDFPVVRGINRIAFQSAVNPLRCISYTAPITPGTSGGPVLNEYGQLLGVAYKGSGNLAFAVAAEYVHKMLALLD